MTELALDLSSLRAKNDLRAAGFDPCLTKDCEGFYEGAFENLLICELCQQKHCATCKVHLMTMDHVCAEHVEEENEILLKEKLEKDIANGEMQ